MLVVTLSSSLNSRSKELSLPSQTLESMSLLLNTSSYTVMRMKEAFTFSGSGKCKGLTLRVVARNDFR
jgi:hypothetical protein